MTTLTDQTELTLTEQQSLFLLSVVLSPTRRMNDVYLKLAEIQGKQISIDRFNELFTSLKALKLIRSSDGMKGQSFIYFRPEGLAYGLYCCQQQDTYHMYQWLERAVTSPSASYAHFCAYCYDQTLTYKLDEELLEQSYNDNLMLLKQTDLPWYLPLDNELISELGDYYLSAWLNTVKQMPGTKPFDVLNQHLSATVKRNLPVHLVRDSWLYSLDAKKAVLFTDTVDEHYLEVRQKAFPNTANERLSYTHLIDLALLMVVKPELAHALRDYYYSMDSVQPYASGALEWFKEMDYLTLPEEQLAERFDDPDTWLTSVVSEERIAWGALFLDLLQLCRVKSSGFLTDFFAQLKAHPATSTLLNSTESFNLACQCRRALRYLLDIEDGNVRFMDKPDIWRMWLKEVEKVVDGPNGKGDERLVWVIEDLKNISCKIQKHAKKGWTKGRAVTVDRLRYGYTELQSEFDRSLAHELMSANHYWRNELPLSKSALQLLSQCDNVVDSAGQPMLIVPESALLVIDEADEHLQLRRFPKSSKSKALLRERSEGIFCYSNIPEKAERFFSLSESVPKVPAGHAEHLVQLIGEQVDWYSMTDQDGNISLGEWDERVHLWLKLTDGILEVALEHQSQDGRYKIGSGLGEEWLHADGSTWFKRDLKQEKSQAKQVAKTLGLKAKAGDFSWHVPADQLDGVLSGLSELKDVPIQWHKSSRRVHSLGAKDIDLSIKENAGWFDVSGQAKLDGGLVLDFQRLLEARRTGYIEVEKDNLTVMINEELRKQLSLLDSVLNESQSVHSQMAYPLQKLINTMSVKSDNAWQELEQEWAKPVGLDPQSLSALRDYQHSSVEWAVHLAHNGFGACLADDMGLGKTVQALKVIEHFKSQGPSLVVCPKSVLLNWQQEAERFASGLTIIDLEACQNRSESIKEAKAGDVVLMSYGLVTRLTQSLQEAEWQTVALDEAQQIKNPTAQRTKVLTALQAERRLTLSGTPVENHLVELWSQFSFLNPGLLGSLTQFKEKYGQAGKNEEDMLRLRALVSPFVMRRTKKEVLTELPEKTELIHHVSLSTKERSAYEAVRKDSLKAVDDSEGNPAMKLFAALTRLRQVCCDPYLVFDSMPDASSKQKEALHLIQEALEGGHKVLVFSQFVQLLRRFAERLSELKIGYSYLDGQSTSRKRAQAIERFKNGEHDLFLISLKAGGTGLNLTEADTVIHLDPWWNPAVEDQASDRAYRMGQTNPVTVYRLVATNTIEEKIIKLHEEKRELADKILTGQSETSSLSPELLMKLLVD